MKDEINFSLSSVPFQTVEGPGHATAAEDDFAPFGSGLGPTPPAWRSLDIGKLILEKEQNREKKLEKRDFKITMDQREGEEEQTEKEEEAPEEGDGKTTTEKVPAGPESVSGNNDIDDDYS